MRVYFAHPMTTYDSKLERDALKAVENKFPDEDIINPAEHPSDDMEFYFELVRDSDVIVFTTTSEGIIGKGVHDEVHLAHSLRKPVWFYNPGKGRFFLSYLVEVLDECTSRYYAKAKENVLSESEIVIVDIETTSKFADEALVVEVAAVALDCQNFTYHNLFDSLCNPGLSKEALEKAWICRENHISPEEILSAPPILNIAAEFHRVLGDSPWTSYNVMYDSEVLSRRPWSMSQNTFPCIMVAAKPACCIHHPKYGIKLPSLSEAHDMLVQPQEEAHRALSDAEMAARVLIDLIKNDHYIVR